MRLCAVVSAAAILALPATCLHFYLDGSTSKCFFEDLPHDTLVVGHYAALEFDEQKKDWTSHSGLSTYITVDEIFDNDHRVVSQRGGPSGRFTFSSASSGDHKICFTVASTSGRPLWKSVSTPNGGIRLKLDLVLGDSSELHSNDKEKLEDITSRIQDLHSRLSDIRREQVFQREREADFRDKSEATNGRVIRWIFVQLAILGITCAWQLSHLRNFFIKQKLT